jgi:UDP-3-O-[3-hydroxymyristoyl] N-acetylglucosamine deacetylase
LYHDGADAVNGELMKKRRTLASERVLEGVGLHSGAVVRLRLRPAPPNAGIVFVRTDLGCVRIPALIENVGPSFYATVLQKDGATVSTIEHLMAALYAMQVDDLDIEIDAAEAPIFDGSSKPFVEAILAAGFRDHDVVRQYLHVTKPVTVTHEDKKISVHPCPEYRVTYAIDFDHPALGYQELTASLWRVDQFVEKIAPARTFTFEHEVAALRERGLALGGSLENAVVVGEVGLLNPPLRFSDEFVRHKMLDLTGDLSLLGRPLRGHVVAYRAGHDLHARLARAIADAKDAWYLAPWAEAAGESPAP